MAGSKPNHFFFFVLNIPLFLFLLSIFFLPLHAASNLHANEDASFPAVDEGMEKGLVERRIAAETAKKPNSVILAAERTYRRDPLHNFEYYTGGWNITDRHYIASVAFSAVVPFAVACAWLLVFGIALLILCFRRCCCSSKEYGYSPTAYALSLTFLTIFTIGAIAGIGLVYKGETQFHSSIIDTVSYVLNEANRVIGNLQELLGYLRAAKKVGVGPISLPEDIVKQIDSNADKINNVAEQFRNVTSKDKTQIKSFTKPLRTVLFCVATAMLVLAICGFLFSILNIQFLVYCLAIIGWLLVAVALILTGVFLLVHNAVADTRVAVDEWLQNPAAHSALESIIPKVDNETITEISSLTKGVTYGVITMVNGVITNVSNINFPPEAGPLYYNQSGPKIPPLCNPYDINLADSKCGPGEISLNNASQVWKSYVCQVSDAGICTTRGRLTPNQYTQFSATANVSYGLYSGMPLVIELVNTTYIQKLSGVISQKFCPKLEFYTKLMYIAFFASSSAVMISIILWFFYARQRRQRAYTHKLDQRAAVGQFSYYN